jgi:hypothetical protein
MLLQGWNPLRRFVGMKPTPVFDQLRLVKSSPLDDQRQGTRRKIAPKHAGWPDLEPGFSTSVVGMEMRRLVIEEVHADHDPEESRDFRHRPSQIQIASLIGA